MKVKKIKPLKSRPEPEINFIESFPSINLLGQPGYRNSHGKSGLGYFETQTEMARMKGLMFSWLITGKFKTRNPVFLIFLTFVGVINSCPIFLLFAGEGGRRAFFGAFFLFAPYTLIGILILINVALSLIKCEEGESITGD